MNLFLVATLSTFCMGITIAEDGLDEGYWDNTGISSRAVIVAQVVKVDKIRPSSGVGICDEVTMSPIATLTGAFDSCKNNEIKCCANFGPLVSTTYTPQKNEFVVVLIEWHTDGSHFVHDNVFVIPSDPILYLPQYNALTRLPELDFKHLQPYLEEIRKVQAENKKRNSPEEKAAREKLWKY